MSFEFGVGSGFGGRVKVMEMEDIRRRRGKREKVEARRIVGNMGKGGKGNEL